MQKTLEYTCNRKYERCYIHVLEVPRGVEVGCTADMVLTCIVGHQHGLLELWTHNSLERGLLEGCK
jgi:hypothetical protein